jgi:hypothetical protein
MIFGRLAARAEWVASLALAAWLACCAAPGQARVGQDLSVTIQNGGARPALSAPNARLAAAAGELRGLLGHPIAIELDPALLPEVPATLDDQLTQACEIFVARLERSQREESPLLLAARARLHRIVERYRPGQSRDDGIAWSSNDTVVISFEQRPEQLIPADDILDQLAADDSRTRAVQLAKLDVDAVPLAEQGNYVRWLRGQLEQRGRSASERTADELVRVVRASRIRDKLQKPADRRALDKFLVEEALRNFVAGRYPAAGATEAEEALARWLERDFASLDADLRVHALSLLLGSTVRSPRLSACAETLSVREVDLWRAAGHPLPSRQTSISNEFELVICPRPQDASGGRSLVPRCDGGLVHLAWSSEAGVHRLGDLLASRRDPILVEQLMLGANRERAGDQTAQLMVLIRALEGEPELLRAALRTLAEEADGARDLERWKGELRRLWLARPDARGTILYLLAHLDPYDRQRVFSDFANDFGAPVNREEAAAYLDEGYRAVTLLPTIWPALGCDFSRASLLLPRLDAYLDDERERHSYQAITDIRHRLCYEGAAGDLRALSSYFAARSVKRPGGGFAGRSGFFDPSACDRPSAESRGGHCWHARKSSVPGPRTP